MFSRARSGPSGGGASRSGSLSEIVVEQRTGAAVQQQSGEEKVYVAVGKDVKDGNANLRWAATNLAAARRGLVLLHVHQPADRIPMGFSKLPASLIEENKLRAYRQDEREKMSSILNQYSKYCTVSLQIQAETMVVENSNVPIGILELIARHQITELVMGASAISGRKAPRSRVATNVHQQANPCCKVYFIYGGALACTREASCVSDLPDLRSVSLPAAHAGLTASQDQAPLPRRSYSVNSISPASSVDMTPEAQTSENLYWTELKQKNEIEERLIRAMMEAVKLTRKLQLERDNAVREAKDMRQVNSNAAVARGGYRAGPSVGGPEQSGFSPA